MRNLKLILKREYIGKVRNRTFIIMTFLSPLIMVGMIALVAYLTMLSSEEKNIVAIHDQSAVFLDEFKTSDNTEFIDYSNFPLEAAKDSAKVNDYEGLLYIPKNFSSQGNKNTQPVFFAKKSPDPDFLRHLENVISKEMTNQKLVANGVNLVKLAESQTHISIKIKDFSGQRSSKMSLYIKMFFGGAAGYLLMMFIIIYGNMVMRSVIEEKTNRIIEIIVSSVKPIQLMLGKIIGTSLAGITQFVIWVILGGILLFVVSAVFGLDMAQMQGPAQQQAVQHVADQEMQQVLLDIASLPLLKLMSYFILYFIGGYFLYSSIYAAIGAAVDNETDTQQFMLPVIIPLMLAIYVGFFAVIENPHGTIATVFSMIPLTSPVVMLMRIPFGVPWWEIALSLLILVLTIFATVWLAAKIYRVGILMYGKKPTYKELYKWLRYKS